MNTDAESRGDFSRISIDSRNEWLRIRESLSEGAAEALRRQLASSGSSSQFDLYLPHVQAFLDRAIRAAKPNLRVNGRNLEDVDEDEQDTDQFDEVLDRRVWSLSDQRLKWDLEIASKRRTMPQEVEALMQQLIEQQREHDNSHNIDDAEMDLDIDVDDDSFVQADDQTSVRSAELLSELSKRVPEQLDRAQRVVTVEREIRSLKT